jgi:Tol biopolymer transport system component/tRNA A-37 threonylcarbamoyl transferase component Bud32
MTAPPESMPDQLRDALADRYRVEAELGRGATAIVYRAFDHKHGRPVAIKVLNSDLAATVTGERFLREILFAAQLQHPHILPMLDSGQAAGSVYFVMPLVDGETLRARLERSPPLTHNESIRILLDLADALSFAHRHGVVHRDIKPENIMLTGRNALIMDFGVAKGLNQPVAGSQLTRGVALGTPTYMSPEQALASPEIDHRADLYALGVVGYEMFAGRPPFIGPTPQEVLTAHVVLQPEPLRSRCPDLPVAVAEVIEKCLAKSPDDRWESAAKLIEHLEGVVTSSGAAPPVRRPLGWGWRAIGVTAVIGVGMLAWDVFLRRSADRVAVVRPERVSFLGNVREAALSPDGSTLAYVTATGDGQRLWIQDSRGTGQAIEVAASERIVGATWIDRGSMISYAEGPADAPTTRIVSRLGGSTRIVGHGRGLVSPNGELVLLATGGDPTLLVLRRATGDTIRLRRPADGWMSGIAWSPNSDRLAFTIIASDRSGSTLGLLDLAGTATEVLAEPGDAVSPLWSPDGRSLYFLAGHAGSGKDLMRVEVSGGGRTLVAANLPVAEDSRRHPTGTVLSIDADGRRLVFVEEEAWSNLARFRLGGRDRGQPPTPDLFTMGTALYSSPRLSPGGDRIAVFVTTARGSTLGTVEAQGNTLTELAVVEQGGSLAWSPQGNAVAYTAEIADSGLRLVIHEIESGASSRPIRAVGLELDWGAEGIVVQRPGNRGLVHLRPSRADSGDPMVDENATTTYSPRVSPDGRSVAVMAYPGNGGPVGLSLVPIGERTYRLLLPGAYRPIGWSSDGRFVYAARNSFAPAPEELIAVPVDGGPPRPLATLPAGFRSEDLSLDGQLLLATQVQSRSDTWQLALPDR